MKITINWHPTAVAECTEFVIKLASSAKNICTYRLDLNFNELII